MNFKKSGKKKAITFSYDDGVTQDIPLVDLLNKYNLKGTFNLNSGRLGENGLLVRDAQNIARYKVHPDDVKQIYAGHEVAAHTLTHPLLTRCDDDEIIRQVETDRCRLSELVGYEVVGMAYPGGGENNNDHIAKIIKENTGIKYSRTIASNNSFDPQDNLYRFNPTIHQMSFEKAIILGEEFLSLEADTPKIFYIWGHSYELDYDSTRWPKLEEFFKLISNQDDIFYGTNKEILL